MSTPEMFDMFKDGAKSSSPNAGQYAIAYALMIVAEEIRSIGGMMDVAADTLGKGPLADGLSSIARAIADWNYVEPSEPSD
jgi:hypothetical protein